LYIPVFNPNELNGNTLNTVTEFDVGGGYTFERGGKRKARINAARDATAVTRSQVKDTGRSLTFNVAQQFVAVLQAKANLDLADQDLASFRKTVDLSSSQYKAGAISEGNLLKIKLQLLQFQTDVANAYQTLKVNDEIVQLYASGYLKQAQDSPDISEYAYKRGAASLLDFLDAERSYRATQLAYRQSLANYMLSIEQVKEAVGTRNLP